MPTKNDDNTQFGRAANADGSSPIGVGAANDGLAPLLDTEGRLITVPYVGGAALGISPTLVDSGAVVINQLISGAAAKLYQCWGNQVSGAMLWFMLFNVAATPPAGAPYVAAIPVPSGGMFSCTFSEGLDFSTGIVGAWSTSQVTYVAPIIGGWISGLIR